MFLVLDSVLASRSRRQLDSMTMDRARARTLPALDLSVPRDSLSDSFYDHMCYDGPLNLSSGQTDRERDACTPPKTPTTPFALSYKKNMLKRYGK